MKKLLASSIIAVLMLMAIIHAQPPEVVLWYSKIARSMSEGWTFTEVAIDGNFVTSGTRGGYFSFLLNKTDINGNVLWQQIYSEESSYCRGLDKTDDGGYILIGDKYQGIEIDAWMVKTDSNGNMVWNRTFGSMETDLGRSIRQTSDGGFVFTGRSPLNGIDIWLVKTDSLGELEWEQSLGTSAYEEGFSVTETEDGGFCITGSFANQIGVLKTDSLGNEEWVWTYGISYGGQVGYWIEQTSDGGYVFTGNYYQIPPFHYAFIGKLDANGSTLWFNTYNTVGSTGFCVQRTNDGGFVVSGLLESLLNDFLLYKTNSQGDLIWYKTWPRSESDDILFAVAQTTDGGYITSGVRQFAFDSTYIYLIRLAPESLSENFLIQSDTLPKAKNITAYHDTKFGLAASPNPFNLSTTISLALPTDTKITLAIYSLNGRMVVKLANGNFGQGYYQFTFDASTLPSGIYFCQLKYNDVFSAQKIVLLK